MKKIYKIKNRTVYLPHIRASAVVQASFSFLFLNQISAAGGGGGGGGGGGDRVFKKPPRWPPFRPSGPLQVSIIPQNTDGRLILRQKLKK